MYVSTGNKEAFVCQTWEIMYVRVTKQHVCLWNKKDMQFNNDLTDLKLTTTKN